MNIKKLSLLLLNITLINIIYCAEKEHTDFGSNKTFKSEPDNELDLFDAELAFIVDTKKAKDDLLRSVSRGLSSISLSDGEKTPSQVMEEKRSGRYSGGTKSVLSFEKQTKRKKTQQISRAIYEARKVGETQEDWNLTSPIQRKRSSSTSVDTKYKKVAQEYSATLPNFTPDLALYREEEVEMITK